MAEDDKIEMGIGPAKIAASGRSVSRIGDSLADLISPFSQGLGLVGDHIRIFRERSVAAVLERAKSIANERGEDIEPTNLKNLIPILENASLESADSELIELWSRLLLSGSDAFDPELAMFTDILKRISSKEAGFLKQVYDGCRKYDDHVFPDIVDRNNREWVPVLVRSIPKTGDDRYSAAVTNKFREQNLVFGRMLYIGGLDDNSKHATSITNDYTDNSSSIDILAYEKLLELKHVQFQEDEYKLSVTYCEISAMGLRLIHRCYPASAN